MRNKITKVIFFIVFLLAMSVIAPEQKAYAADPEIDLTLVDKDGKEYYLESKFEGIYEITKSGKGWKYDDKTNTLTLNNFVGKSIRAKINDPVSAELNIVLKGTNKFEDKSTDYTSAVLAFNDQGYTHPINVHFKGKGKLTVTQKDTVRPAIFADSVSLEGSVYVKCVSKGEYGYLSGKTTIGKNTTMEATGAIYGYYSGNYDENGMDVINGTLIAKCTDKNYVQAYYYTTYKAKLGKDRVIYGGSSKKSAKKLTLVKDSYATYMNYEKHGHLKYVMICGKNDKVKKGRISK